MITLCGFADEAAKTPEGQVAILRRCGIPLLELRSMNGKNVSEFTEEEATAYRKILDDGGIRVWSIGSPLGKAPIDTDADEYLKTVRHICRLAVIFGCQRIRAFSFYGVTDARRRERMFGIMDRMADIAHTYGLTLCHENEKDIYGDTVDRVEDLRSHLHGWQYVYDPANFLQVGESPARSLSRLAPTADYFHIKDVIAATGEMVPAGAGDGQIERLVAGIKGDKVLTLEPHLATFDAYASIDKTELKTKLSFASSDDAFCAAATALKSILQNNGYREMKGEPGVWKQD